MPNHDLIPGQVLFIEVGALVEKLLTDADPENGYRALLEVTDYLVDGRFEQDKKSYELHFKGSSNQRFIDVQKSLAAGEPVVLESL